MKILVIGAGINGILTANILQNNGYSVDVIDAESSAGMRTTFANGCQLSFSHTTPMLIKPSLFSTPFKKPLILPKTTKKWLKEHQKCYNFEERFNHLTNLAIQSKEAFKKLFLQYNNLPENIGHSSGTVFLFRNSQQFELRKQIFQKQKNHYQIDFQSESQPNAIEFDDSLLQIDNSVKHFIFTPYDQTLNALEFTRFIAKEFLQNGGKIHYDTQITKIANHNGIIEKIHTNKGIYTNYDTYIYTGGASGVKLLQDFNLSLQVVTGYSLTFDVSYSNYCPQRNIIDFDNKIVYSRHNDILRVAGFFDLDIKNHHQRIHNLYKIALNTFPILKNQKLIYTWHENRVFTHNEIPITEKISKNFIVNTAQGHLGITLSAGSAERILQIIKSL